MSYCAELTGAGKRYLNKISPIRDWRSILRNDVFAKFKVTWRI